MMNRLMRVLPVLALLMCAEANGAAIKLPQTGQSKCYNSADTEISCTGTGQDGEEKAGVAWPNPRFTDNNDGTVTDNLTGLVWLKNANCTATVGGIAKGNGFLTWPGALTWSNSLTSGLCGLTDGSVAREWRLPNITEMESLLDLSQRNPALPPGHPFTNVQVSYYWSSSTHAANTSYAWYVDMVEGYMFNTPVYKSSYGNYVWPVRDRK